MKLIILSCIVACAVADVSHIVKNDESKAAIVNQELDLSPEGSYQYGYQSENGISVQAKGEIVNANAETPVLVSQGQIQYTSPEGQPIILQYVADQNGFQPQGDHLPTPPPIPEGILRALEYIRSHPPPPEKK